MVFLKKVLLIFLIGFLVPFFSEGSYGSAIAQSHYPGQHEDKLSVKESVSFKALAFDLQDVQLLSSRFTENMKRESDFTNRLNVRGKAVEIWLQPVDGELLTFKTNPAVCGKEYLFRPLYDIHHERYNVYWTMK